MTSLHPRQYLRLSEPAGTSIRAHSGMLWITEQASRRDVLLRAGQSFTFTRPGLALVEAFAEASVSFHRGGA
jgi:hypothetical protein